jgi:hypothetical protein
MVRALVRAQAQALALVLALVLVLVLALVLALDSFCHILMGPLHVLFSCPYSRGIRSYTTATKQFANSPTVIEAYASPLSHWYTGVYHRI